MGLQYISKSKQLTLYSEAEGLAVRVQTCVDVEGSRLEDFIIVTKACLEDDELAGEGDVEAMGLGRDLSVEALKPLNVGGRVTLYRGQVNDTGVTLVHRLLLTQRVGERK